jgi:hypothetical protein
MSVESSLPPRPPVIPGFEGVPDAPNFINHNVLMGEHVQTPDPNTLNPAQISNEAYLQMPTGEETNSTLLNGAKVAYFGLREALASRRSTVAAERADETEAALRSSQRLQQREQTSPVNPAGEIVPANMSKRELAAFRKSLEAKARFNRVSKAYGGTESQTTGFRARRASSGQYSAINGRYRSGEINLVQRHTERLRADATPVAVKNREQKKATRDLRKANVKLDYSISQPQPEDISEMQTQLRDAIHSYRDREQAYGIRAFEYETQKSLAKSKIAQESLRRKLGKASEHATVASSLLNEAELLDQGLDADGSTTNRFTGVDAEIKRHKASVAETRATKLRAVHDKLTSGQSVKLTDRIRKPNEVLRNTTKAIGLHANKLRERAADWRVGRLRKSSEELSGSSLTGLGRWTPSLRTRSRYVGPEAQMSYAKKSQELSEKADKLEAKTQARRGRKYPQATDTAAPAPEVTPPAPSSNEEEVQASASAATESPTFNQAVYEAEVIRMTAEGSPEQTEWARVKQDFLDRGGLKDSPEFEELKNKFHEEIKARAWVEASLAK